MAAKKQQERSKKKKRATTNVASAVKRLLSDNLFVICDVNATQQGAGKGEGKRHSRAVAS